MMDSIACLGEAADRLNAVLTECEAGLRQRALGVTASVKLPSGGAVCFGKLDREWRLLFDPGNGGVQPLMNAPRLVRVEAAASLVPLYQALHAAVTVHQRQVETAIEQAAAFLDFLRVAGNEGGAG